MFRRAGVDSQNLHSQLPREMGKVISGMSCSDNTYCCFFEIQSQETIIIPAASFYILSGGSNSVEPHENEG